MIFRCNRLGNLFVKRMRIEILLIYIFWAIPVVIWILAGGIDTFRQWWVFLIIGLIPAVTSVVWIMQFPKDFTYESKKLIWVEDLRVVRSKDLCKTTITVGDLYAVEFIQSPIERLFNIGQIRFMGDIRSLDAPNTVERPAMPFWYGGIREFDRFKECLHQTLPKNAFLR